MKYIAIIEMPDDIAFEQSKKALKHGMQLSDAIKLEIRKAMYNMTGNNIIVDMSTSTEDK